MFPSAGRREAQEDTPTPWIGGGRRSSSVLVTVSDVGSKSQLNMSVSEETKEEEEQEEQEGSSSAGCQSLISGTSEEPRCFGSDPSDTKRQRSQEEPGCVSTKSNWSKTIFENFASGSKEMTRGDVSGEDRLSSQHSDLEHPASVHGVSASILPSCSDSSRPQEDVPATTVEMMEAAEKI
ncbi:hypothetical protein FQA47_018250 [Oryzias melastigma]|uniref:Uncharacterized protein n=1 Tax=Oryzias melastigma TaxID=30732 RepID=A0A834FRY8_ORYME|nr:hypothetical protein FQA47_018250 [Oryzias melastigma]